METIIFLIIIAVIYGISKEVLTVRLTIIQLAELIQVR